MYQVRLAEDAQQAFEDAQEAFQRRLDRCFAMLAADPRRHPNIRRLTGRLAGYFRYRVGDWLVVYRIDEGRETVWVVGIEHRREVYR